ncbi:MAG: carboxymuconolactone decarboxylase family protein [Actinobacteria bacterium]|nr:MAG: carboxymuconolactone decarboxylase family protein [Actinomycetota bacterium]
MSAPSGPRLAPITSERWDDDVRAALSAGFGPGAADRLLADPETPLPNVLGTMMNHPRLLAHWLAFNGKLLRDPAIDARLRELMILRVGWRTRANYEWLQHVRIARGLGITTAEIEAITREYDPDLWAPLEPDLLAATDQLLDRYRIDDDTWARLAKQLDEQQLMEVVWVVGTYTVLAMAFNSFGIQLDPDLHSIDAPEIREPEPNGREAGAERPGAEGAESGKREE